MFIQDTAKGYCSNSEDWLCPQELLFANVLILFTVQNICLCCVLLDADIFATTGAFFFNFLLIVSHLSPSHFMQTVKYCVTTIISPLNVGNAERWTVTWNKWIISLEIMSVGCSMSLLHRHSAIFLSCPKVNAHRRCHTHHIWSHDPHKHHLVAGWCLQLFLNL